MAPLDFEAAIGSAVTEKIIAGASLAAIYKTKHGRSHILYFIPLMHILTLLTGVERYANAFGSESLAPNVPPMGQDSLLWLASCTKVRKKEKKHG